MMANFFQKARLKSAARKYARQLGPHLNSAYGSSEYYTPEQIRHAAQKCGLDARYLRLGYAAFLPENAFREVVAGEFATEYDSLRKIYLAFVPEELRSAGGAARENRYAVTGGVDPWV